MTTRRGFFGMLGAIPLSVKLAVDNAGRRANEDLSYPRECYDVSPEPPAEDVTVNIGALKGVELLQLYDRRNHSIIVPATISAPKDFEVRVETGPLNSWDMDERGAFTIVTFELLDGRRHSLYPRTPVATERTVGTGDSLTLDLELC